MLGCGVAQIRCRVAQIVGSASACCTAGPGSIPVPASLWRSLYLASAVRILEWASTIVISVFMLYVATSKKKVIYAYVGWGGVCVYPFDWTLEARLINLLSHLRSFYSSGPAQAYHFFRPIESGGPVSFRNPLSCSCFHKVSRITEGYGIVFDSQLFLETTKPYAKIYMMADFRKIRNRG
jgi:hypothetical protein